MSNAKNENKITSITTGGLKRLSHKIHTQYKYVVTSPFSYKDESMRLIDVSAGFLTDGASGGAPDYGVSWCFHDYLYATHKFSSGEECSREDADEIMYNILMYERLTIYARVFKMATWLNPFYLFSKAYETSGRRGAEYLEKSESDDWDSIEF